MPKDEELNQQLKNHKIPLRGGGRNLLPNGERLEISGGGRTSPHLYTEWQLKKSNHPHQTQNRHPGGFSEGRRVCAANPARMIKQPNEAKFCEGKMKRSALAVSARIIRYNLFQGLTNVAGGDDLNPQTAVNCDKARFRNKFGMTSKKSGNLESHIA